MLLSSLLQWQTTKNGLICQQTRCSTFSVHCNTKTINSFFLYLKSSFHYVACLFSPIVNAVPAEYFIVFDFMFVVIVILCRYYGTYTHHVYNICNECNTLYFVVNSLGSRNSHIVCATIRTQYAMGWLHRHCKLFSENEQYSYVRYFSAA